MAKMLTDRTAFHIHTYLNILTNIYSRSIKLIYNNTRWIQYNLHHIYGVYIVSRSFLEHNFSTNGSFTLEDINVYTWQLHKRHSGDVLYKYDNTKMATTEIGQN